MSHWSYLPFLLAWALPIVGIEWLLGGRYLWRERRLWPWVVLGLGVYFSLADALAIAEGIWRFDAQSLVGVAIGPVPLEEVLFYLLTAAMVVQGFVVFWFGAQDSWRLLVLPTRVKRGLASPERHDFSPSPSSSAPPSSLSVRHSAPAGTPDD